MSKYAYKTNDLRQLEWFGVVVDETIDTVSVNIFTPAWLMHGILEESDDKRTIPRSECQFFASEDAMLETAWAVSRSPFKPVAADYAFSLNDDDEVEWIGRVVSETWDTLTLKPYNMSTLHLEGDFKESTSTVTVQRKRSYRYPSKNNLMHAAWPRIPALTTA